MTSAEFEFLVNQNYRYMRAVARRKLRSWHDAEDAVQRALLNLWRRVEHLDASDALAAFSTLLVQATLAAAVDIIRERVGTKDDASGGRRAAEVAFASHQRTISSDGSGGGRRVRRKRKREVVPVSGGPSQEDLVRLHEALALMPPEYAAAMVEVYGKGAKIAYIAGEMGLDRAALRQKLHRFRKDIREVLDT